MSKIFLICSLFLSTIILEANTFRDGMKAYRKGDFQRAKILFEESFSKNKSTSAAYMLGRLYLNGEGVEENLDKAIKLFIYAFDSGNIPAGCYLSEAYMKQKKHLELLAEGLVPGLRKKVPHCKKVFRIYKNYPFEEVRKQKQ